MMDMRLRLPILGNQAEWDLAKDNHVVRYLILSIYGIIFPLGFLGNSLVVYVVARRSYMHTSTNLFIANLALSDILMTLVATPFTPFAIYSDDWFLPAILCKILPMTMGVSVYVSTLTSTAIAADRYFVIVNQNMKRMKPWLCGVVILCVWLVGIFISMPLAVYQKKEPRHNDTNQSVCHEIWPLSSSREVFTVVSFCLQFVVPCSVIVYCYYRVSVVLKDKFRTKLTLLSNNSNRQREAAEIRRNRRVNKMLIAMIVIFVICWIPLNILWIVIDTRDRLEMEQIHSKANPKDHLNQSAYFTTIFFTCHILAMSSALYNPFLYAGLNENFLNEFRLVCPLIFNSALFPRHTDNRSRGKEIHSVAVVDGATGVEANPSILVETCSLSVTGSRYSPSGMMTTSMPLTDLHDTICLEEEGEEEVEEEEKEEEYDEIETVEIPSQDTTKSDNNSQVRVSVETMVHRKPSCHSQTDLSN